MSMVRMCDSSSMYQERRLVIYDNWYHRHIIYFSPIALFSGNVLLLLFKCTLSTPKGANEKGLNCKNNKNEQYCDLIHSFRDR